MAVHSCTRMMHPRVKLVSLLVLVLLQHCARAQIINRTPHFIPGSGDMARFSLLENTPVGSVVYQLRGKW